MSQKSFGSVCMDRWDKDEPANDPKHIASSVKHGGGGVMAWACMAVSGTGSLNFTDDLMYDNSSRMNLEGYKTILPTNIQENATRFIGKCFILHQNNGPKHPASSVNEFIRAKKLKVLDLNPIEHEFDQLLLVSNSRPWIWPAFTGE